MTIDGLKRVVVQSANENRTILTGEFRQVREMVDAGDVIYAVWPDAAEPDGIGMLLMGATVARNHRQRPTRFAQDRRHSMCRGGTGRGPASGGGRAGSKELTTPGPEGATC